MIRTRLLIPLLVSLAAFTTLQPHVNAQEKRIPGMKAFRPACDSIERYMSRRSWSEFPLYVKTAYVANRKSKNATLVIKACRDMAFYPFREGDVEHIYAIMRDMMPQQYKAYRNRFRIEANNRMLKAYTPAFYASDNGSLYVREHRNLVTAKRTESTPLVTRASSPVRITGGLGSRHIAVWQSHGYYFERTMNRWEWQRGRIFGTVEDKYTQSYVVPFLVPMLENAGAIVLMPRERDINTNEVIVDNDAAGSGYEETGKWSVAPHKGFSPLKYRYSRGENPFLDGTARQIRNTSQGEGQCAKWIPDIPEDGEYAVYISYQTLSSSAEDARYDVLHSGGKTTFHINQRRAGGTWVYLGTFRFRKGRYEDQGVVLSASGKSMNSTITADAVKFGGGKGNVARGLTGDGESVSGHPRFNEAATYWLQWAGFNDTIYSPTAFENDYKDDIKCRPQWVNTLIKNYNVPIDLAFAFHSDAGLRQGDSIVGTLAIHTWKYDHKDKYSNGERRFLGRDLADIVQSQVVSDLRTLYNPTWTRRGLWDRIYGESSAPQVPTMILELLSHQNFNDMKYGLDPMFRFTVSRAVYKGILRYLCWLNESEYTVQPLPVENFEVQIQNAGGKDYAVLKWTPVEDPLEPTAKPERYIVYKRIGDGGFDNGTVVEGTAARFNIETGKLYSFKVAAANGGGISFPSETLCAGLPETASGTPKKVLIINNFTRISGPESFMSADSLTAGFRYDRDAGVPYGCDICYCGNQYEFRRDAEWESDDYPGFGASENNYDSSVMAGNTFDFVSKHAEALLKSGYGVVSASRGAILSNSVEMASYPVIDLICGKQKKVESLNVTPARRDYSIFPETLRNKLSSYADGAGTILISGAFIGEEADADGFLNDVLKVKYREYQGEVRGEVKTDERTFSFFTSPNAVKYHIERPDGIEPTGLLKSNSILRYGNGLSAGVVYKSSKYTAITLGFPIESLESQEQIDSLIRSLSELF